MGEPRVAVGRGIRRGLLLGVTLALAASGLLVARVDGGVIAERVIGSSATIYLNGLAVARGGDVWFADAGCTGLGHCAIGRMATTGAIRLFRRGLGSGSVPTGIAAGADQTLWFTDQGTPAAIGEVTANGRITEFRRGLRGGSPFEIAAGPDGAMWFTDLGSRPAIGRITPGGRITLFRRGLPHGSMPFGIAPGPGQTLWFTDRG